MLFSNSKHHFNASKKNQYETSINLSTETTYKTQRENKKRPHSSCNTTSMAMGLDIVGFSRNIKVKTGVRLADHLTDFYSSDEGYKARARISPWADKNGIHPAQVHDVLAWGVNNLVGKDIVRFSTNTPIVDIESALWNGRPSVVSGDWPFIDRHGNHITIGHIVILVGLFLDKNGKKFYIIDDPYGDYHTKYKNKNGNDIIMPEEDFLNIVRGNKKTKWAHVFLEKHPEGPFKR